MSSASAPTIPPPARSAARRFLHRFRHGGFPWLISAVANRLVPARAAMRDDVLRVASGGNGLEIGGPSAVFSRGGLLPVYDVFGTLDNVNFTANTAWETNLRDQGSFVFNPAKRPGRQYLREATTLSRLPDQRYDIVISSHCLEHVANPLAALREWRRVVRPGGHLILLLPDPTRTFDQRRPVTTLRHLQDDFDHGTKEDDLTHLTEILRMHDLGRDPHAGSLEAFTARAQKNAENRCLHHHVFDLKLIQAALTDTGWSTVALERVRPLHLVAFARNTGFTVGS